MEYALAHPDASGGARIGRAPPFHASIPRVATDASPTRMYETAPRIVTKAIKHRNAKSAGKCADRKRARTKAVVMTTAAWRTVRLARRMKRAKRRHRRSSQREKAGELRAVSLGSVAVGSFALGASAFGALAVGAVAIRRLAIKRAAVGRLDVRKVKVGCLEVDELIVHSDRRPLKVPPMDGP